jgi:hypothetical protein
VLYAVCPLETGEYVKSDPQAYCRKHTPVWETFAEAKEWRDTYQKKHKIFGVLADWDKDTTKTTKAPYRQLSESLKLVPIDAEGKVFSLK